MINGQRDMDALLWDHFHEAIPMPGQPDIGDDDGEADIAFVPIFFGVAEEEVEETISIPGLRFAYQYDYSLENQKRVRHQPRIYRWVDEDDHDLGVQRIKPPTFRRLVYEIDLYTYKYLDVVELSERVFSRLQREYGNLVDDDGNTIIYRLDDMTDMARRIDEERLFRRLFVFSFDAWVLESIVDIGTPTTFIETVHVNILDHTDESLIDTITLTAPEPEQEDP